MAHKLGVLVAVSSISKAGLIKGLKLVIQDIQNNGTNANIHHPLSKEDMVEVDFEVVDLEDYESVFDLYNQTQSPTEQETLEKA